MLYHIAADGPSTRVHHMLNGLCLGCSIKLLGTVKDRMKYLR